MKYFYLHIPKAGGTTLLHVLDQIYKKSSHYSFDTTRPNECLNELKSYSVKQKEKIKIVSGHFVFGFHELFNIEKFKYFTLLRDPIERIFSHYHYSSRKTNHYLYKTRHESEISLVEYVQSGLTQEVHNGMCKQIAGLYVNDNFGYSNINKDTLSDNELFQKAKQNIKNHFIFAGITEEFDKSLFLLKSYIGHNSINYKYTEKNINTANNKTQKKYNLKKEELEIIMVYNSADIQLYEWCKNEFDKKLFDITTIKNIDKMFTPNALEKIFLNTKKKINYLL